MADAIVSGLVSDVLKSLASFAFQEFRRLQRLEADVSALRDTYTLIQAVLADAEVKQREQKAVEEWLNRLRSASLEVENVLNDALTEAMLQRVHKERGIGYKVRAFFSSNHNPLLVHTRIANKVKTILRKLEVIEAEKSRFHLISKTVSVDAGVGDETTNIDETTSGVPVFEIYGRDEEVKTVVERICSKDIIGDHSIEGFQVYAIWGMGGVGKTTLAQLVYNHEWVKAHFELQAWVHVTSEFNVKKITKGIIEFIDKRSCELPQLDAMQVELQNKLKGKRCLIVLDDVWIEEGDMKKWDELSKALSGAAKGSIVMVTARNHTTSQMLANVPEFQHKVGCLSEDDSWSLFKKLAFASGRVRDGENIMELESIGKEIVDKCKGLPLAVNSLGRLMSLKHNLSEWKSVNDSVVWELQEKGILPALKLSYDNLRPDEKRCFTYCCLFPKGYQMRRNVLIDLWMVNGFITPREHTSLYVIGDQIFNCLVSRSFLQDVQQRYDYRNHSELVCKMHDLMHDLAQNEMKQDFCFTVPGKTLITPGKGEVLHFSSTCSEFSFSGQDLERLRSLRSIFMFGDSYKGDIISQISNHLYLRILFLDGIRQWRLSGSICKLKHLRYLSLSNSSIEILPESIVYLCNLQVLNVQRCTSLRKLPKGLRYMKNLQCLYNQGCGRLKCMPVGIKELSCLRRLEEFKVGFKEGAQIRELGNLNLLGGSLELRELDYVGGLEDAKSANMKDKTNLFSLILSWNGSRSGSGIDEDVIDEDVLEGLEPNSSLNELGIDDYMGKMISPSWMMKLGNLVRIRFWDCRRCESIPSLGKLPSLRVIELSCMSVLKCLDDDEFPSLQKLWVGYCDLVSLPSNLPKLSELHIISCTNLHCLPDGLKELTSLKIWECENLMRRCEKEKGEDWPKISHVPNLDLRETPPPYTSESKPLNGEKLWRMTDLIMKPLPPMARRMPGRPRRARKKDASERGRG